MYESLCLKNLTPFNSLGSEEDLNHQKKLPPQEKMAISEVVRVCPWCQKNFQSRKRSQRFCSPACVREDNASISKLWKRLWPKIKYPNNGCWEWQGNKDKDGYGTLRWRGEQRTHRVAWTLFHGKIQRGLYVLHKCDNPSCVNPTHLFIGDAKLNASDMISKGRQRHPCGSVHHMAKLTENQVREIRRKYKAGTRQSELAIRFGIKYVTINHIVCRRTWKHI